MTRYLAVMLVHTRFDATSQQAQAGDWIGGPALSVFEHAEYLLVHQLGLGLEQSKQKWVLAKPTKAPPKHFASGKFDALLSEIVRVYLGFADWGGDMPTTRQAFQPPRGKSVLVKALSELGYLEAAGDGVRWTDKAGAAMLDASAWDPDFRSLSDKRMSDRAGV